MITDKYDFDTYLTKNDYQVNNLNRGFRVRLSAKQVKVMKLIIRRLKDRYNSPSHFIRCAILRQMRHDADECRSRDYHDEQRRLERKKKH